MDSSSAAMEQQISKHGVMAKQVAQDHHDHLDSSSSSFEVSTTVGSSSSSSSSDQLATGGPLSDLSSLLQQLPIK
jgi:hypothetical protein